MALAPWIGDRYCKGAGPAGCRMYGYIGLRGPLENTRPVFLANAKGLVALLSHCVDVFPLSTRRPTPEIA